MSTQRRWYQKGIVQASFITGLFGLRAASLTHILRDSGRSPVLVSIVTPAENKPSTEQSTHRLPSTPTGRPITNSPPIKKAAAIPPALHPVEAGNRVLVIHEGTPKNLTGPAALLTVTFRETLGSAYVEVMITVPGQAPVLFPARNPGATGQFFVGDIAYRATVMAIDWQTRRVNVIVDRSSA